MSVLIEFGQQLFMYFSRLSIGKLSPYCTIILVKANADKTIIVQYAPAEVLGGR